MCRKLGRELHRRKLEPQKGSQVSQEGAKMPQGGNISAQSENHQNSGLNNAHGDDEDDNVDYSELSHEQLLAERKKLLIILGVNGLLLEA